MGAIHFRILRGGGWWGLDLGGGSNFSSHRLEVAGEEGDGAGNPVLGCVRSHRNHCQSGILKLLDSEISLDLVGLASGHAEGIVAKVASFSRSAARPEGRGIRPALDDANGKDDLRKAKRVVDDELVEVLDGVGHGFVTGDGEAVLPSEGANASKHGSAAVLELRLAEPLGVGEHLGVALVQLEHVEGVVDGTRSPVEGREDEASLDGRPLHHLDRGGASHARHGRKAHRARDHKRNNHCTEHVLRRVMGGGPG